MRFLPKPLAPPCDFHPVCPSPLLFLHFFLKASFLNSSDFSLTSKLPFSLLPAAVSFLQKTSPSLSPWASSRTAPKTGWWELPKGVFGQNGCVIFPKTFSLGTGWSIHLFLTWAIVRLPVWEYLHIWISSTKYTPKMCMYISDQGHDGALIKYRIELNLSASGNHHTWLMCRIIPFVHSTCLGSKHWSKLIEISNFWLPCAENNCSAWRLNKTLF